VPDTFVTDKATDQVSIPCLTHLNGNHYNTEDVMLGYTCYKTHHEDVAISKEERLIPPKRTTKNMHPLSFQVPSSSSDYRKYSFFPRTIRDWNSLPTNTAAATTLVAFKAQVSQLPH
jgi:hypothetical protein